MHPRGEPGFGSRVPRAAHLPARAQPTGHRLVQSKRACFLGLSWPSSQVGEWDGGGEGAAWAPAPSALENRSEHRP